MDLAKDLAWQKIFRGREGSLDRSRSQKNATKFKQLFHFYQLIPLHTQKNVWRLRRDPIYIPYCRTLKESRKICCRVLGFHKLITSEHSTHIHHDARRPPHDFSFLSFPWTNFPGTIFPGGHFRGDHFSGGNFSRESFFRGPFFEDHFSRGPFFRDSRVVPRGSPFHWIDATFYWFNKLFFSV